MASKTKGRTAREVIEGVRKRLAESPDDAIPARDVRVLLHSHDDWVTCATRQGEDIKRLHAELVAAKGAKR